MYRVSVRVKDKMQRVLVRVYADQAEQLVDRKSEIVVFIQPISILFIILLPPFFFLSSFFLLQRYGRDCMPVDLDRAFMGPTPMVVFTGM